MAHERCDGCGRPLTGITGFRLRAGVESTIRCRACALTYPPLLRRSLRIAALVGTVLVLINHGDALVRGAWGGALTWKVPLTYLVPFVVATWGALANARMR